MLAGALIGCSSFAKSIVKGNVAKKRANVVMHGFAPVHASLICDNGDDGFGIDNEYPWYTAYLSADPTDVDAVVTQAASRAGWTLTRDDTALGVYPYLDAQGGGSGDAPDENGGPLAGVPFKNTTTYLADRRGDRALIVDVVRDGTVTKNCSDLKTYGDPLAPAAGKVLIVVEMDAESTAPAPPNLPPSQTDAPRLSESPSANGSSPS